MQPIDKHYCPVCGNLVVESSSVCLHCAAPIASRKPEEPKAGGCLSALVLAIFLGLAIALMVR